MGTLDVRLVSGRKDTDANTRLMLRDMKALEQMLAERWFNEEPIHIGAEQEMCLVDPYCKPMPASLEVLAKLQDKCFTTEIAKFNLEVNLDPLPFTANCFSQLEEAVSQKLLTIRKVGEEMGFDIVITGILPTLRKTDLEMAQLTPLPRYHALIKAIKKMRGDMFELKIRGLDELNVKHDSALLEACNTSFQVHLQVKPDDFVRKYNIALAVAAPVLAIATNSPMLFGKRLWSETRIALFQQSVDTRRVSEHFRDRSNRVTFGNHWLRGSILDLYREDLVRFRPMLMSNGEPDTMELMEKGTTPRLSSLMTHNSTVYRWNRACYGISDNGKPHLRIENRILPAGPTVLDEVANAAFWLGLMEGMAQQYGDITELMEFDDVRSNFVSVCFSGLNTEIKWLDNKKVGISTLIEQELLPLARQGLLMRGVAEEDINRYLGVITQRNASRITGAKWMLDSDAKLSKEVMKDEKAATITSSMIRQQWSGKAVHEWELAGRNDSREWSAGSLLVEEFMTRDVFTVEKDDIPELAANMMDWQKIRYVPVENKIGRLIGLLSAPQILRYLLDKGDKHGSSIRCVGDLMIKDPITISPDKTVAEAMRMMKKHQVPCLPVVKNHTLVGIISEGNFLNVTASLLNVLDNQLTNEQDHRKHQGE
ncbi:MAG: glutamate-cysteine ligase family protein [Cyclobacteriaceae bacterium]